MMISDRQGPSGPEPMTLGSLQNNDSGGGPSGPQTPAVTNGTTSPVDYSAILAATQAHDWQGLQRAIQGMGQAEWDRWSNAMRAAGSTVRHPFGDIDEKWSENRWDLADLVAKQLYSGPTTPGPGPGPGPGPTGHSNPQPQMTESNPLAQMLRRIGVTGPLTGSAPSVNPITGASLSGPNPMITSPFRHLFNQQQVDAYGVKTPMQVSSINPITGVYDTKQVNWWDDPNTTLASALTNLTVPRAHEGPG